MALESAVNFKAAIATAAADLTTAWTDTVNTETAIDIRNPSHPLRQIEKLFSYDPATGVVSSDDAYIDAAYAGEVPNKSSEFDVISELLAPTLVSATVEDAEKADIVLTFSQVINHELNVAVGGDTTKNIISVTAVGAVVTIVVDADYANGDTITVDGIFIRGDRNITLSAEAVTNNVV